MRAEPAPLSLATPAVPAAAKERPAVPGGAGSCRTCWRHRWP